MSETTHPHTLSRLAATIDARKGADPSSSYVAKLLADAPALPARQPFLPSRFAALPPRRAAARADWIPTD